MPMSSPICAAAASSGRTGTRPPSSPTSSAPGTIIIAVAEDLIRRRITSAAAARRGRRQPGRPAGRHRDHPAAGTVPRGDHPGAAVRHAALPSDRRRRVVDRRIWRSAHPRAARLDRSLFALSASRRRARTYPMPFIETSTADDRVHPGHGRKAAARLAAARPALLLLREYRGRPRRGGEPAGDGAADRARIYLRDEAAGGLKSHCEARGPRSGRGLRPPLLTPCARLLRTKLSPPRRGSARPTPIVARGALGFGAGHRIGAIIGGVIGARAVVAGEADAAERRGRGGAVGRLVPVDHAGADIGPEAVVKLRAAADQAGGEAVAGARWPRRWRRRNRGRGSPAGPGRTSPRRSGARRR